MHMTEAERQKKIEQLAKKRDHAADVLNKPLLAWSYQVEIDDLAEGDTGVDDGQAAEITPPAK
jgi:hypothetical protein